MYKSNSIDKITKAVIPAAGLGTRMEPISSYLPKPMLPLGRKPVLQHIVDELQQSGIEEVGLIVRSDHQVIWDYFVDQPVITFIEDNTASGPGGAILQAEEFITGDDFVVIFSDAPVRGSKRSDYLKKLMSINQKQKAKATLSIYQIPQSEVSSRGIVRFEKQNLSRGEPVQLTDIVEKPSNDERVSQWASTCRYVLDAQIFDALKSVAKDDDGELQLTPAIRYILDKGQPVLGLSLPEYLQRYDTGNFEGYFEPFGDFAK